MVLQTLIPELEESRLRDLVTKLSSFPNRYYTTPDGVEAAEWIASYAKQYTPNVRFFNHSWAQPSVIARLEGSDASVKDQVVILGAHLDSIARWGFNFRTLKPEMKAPGADDDASGSATLLELLRILTKTGFQPKKTIEFHWYSAEEVGLRGSMDIASSYANSSVDVYSMLQLDMTGYVKPGEGRGSIGILEDFVNPFLTEFMVKTVVAYTSLPYKRFKCGYGCEFLFVSPSWLMDRNLIPSIFNLND